MFGILAKFFRFSGRENGNKFKLSIVIGLIEALASAMKIPAIMYILIGLLSGKTTGKYIGGSIAIMVLAIVIDVICKRYSTVLQTEGGYNASAFMRIKIAEHLRYLPMGYFNSNSIGEISSITTNTMEILGDVAARVVMLTMQGILETSMIIFMLFLLCISAIFSNVYPFIFFKLLFAIFILLASESSNSTILLANSSTLSTSTRNPFSPGLISSIPATHRVVVIMGSPHAIASLITNPQISSLVGSTKTSEA